MVQSRRCVEYHQDEPNKLKWKVEGESGKLELTLDT